MSLDTINAEGIEQGLQRWAANPGPEPETGFSVTSFLGSGLKGFPSAALESAGSVADVLSGFGTAAAASGGSAGGMFSIPTEQEQKQEAQARDRMLKGDAFDTGAGNVLRAKAQEFAPDPQTAHKADQVMHGLVRFGAKAVTAVGTMGPAGAILLGLDEGNTVTQNLRAEGVDTATATKVGAVQGTIAAASVVLPLGGKTLAQTIGLVGVGGPGSYIAQEHFSRKILEEAGYLDQASLHNPFDPLGLALSTIIPGGFGAMHMRGQAVRGKAVEAGTIPLGSLRPEELRALKYDDPRLDALARQAAEAHGVPPALLLAIKNVGEKSGPTAVSPKGAQGVMQFMPGTAKEMGLADRTDPVASIDAGARYMRKLFDAYGSWDAAVAHYNGGGAQAAIVRGGGRPTAKETMGYLDRVQQYVAQHTAQEAAQHPEAVDAARVATTNEALVRSLPDTPDAVAQVMRASDIVAERGGRAAELEIAPVEPLTFTTAKGSTYEVGDGGVTTRNKAARSDVGHEGDSGPQATSEATYYVSSEQAIALGEFQVQGRAAAHIAELPDGRIGMRYTEGPNAGQFEGRTVVMPSREPAVGMTPVELWKDGRRVHFGNEITEVRQPAARTPRASEESAAPAPRQREADNALPPHDSITVAGDEPAKRGAEVGAVQEPQKTAGAPAGGQEPAKGAGGAGAEPASLDAALAQKLATEQPDLMVTLPGSDERISVAEALARISEVQKEDGQWADLVRVAAECALTAG